MARPPPQGLPWRPSVRPRPPPPMARFPGTETQTNRAGLVAGQALRCRRSRANAARDVADRRGFVVDLRAGHVCLLLDMAGTTVWLESEAVLPEPLPEGPLERFRQAFVLLDGRRLERDDEAWTILGESFPAEALDQARALLADRLEALTLAAHGVHELAVHLRLRPADEGTT